MKEGILSATASVEAQLQQICATYSPYSAKYKFCPGIAVAEYKIFKEIVSFDTKDVRITQDPIARIDSTSCEVWYSLSESRLVSREQKPYYAIAV